MKTDDEAIEKLQETFRDAARHQIETLTAILERNSGASYLHPYLRGYDAPADAATFRRAVPLSSYDDYADYINKLADGVLLDDHGQPLLSLDPFVCFFYSSGTASMTPKLLPYFDSKPGRENLSLVQQGTDAVLRRLFQPRSSSNKVLGFIYAGNVTETKGGFKAMAVSAFPLQSNNPNASQLLSIYISPKEVILGTNVNQQMYCHLLCGLRHFELIDGISALYAISLIQAFNLLETNWEKLSEDLEKGFPSSDVTDVAMRESVIKVLGGPRSDLSKRVRLTCEESSWGGIVQKLWPNVRYVKSVTTGSMMQYYQKLKYYSGDITILGGSYFATECCVGINLDLLQPPELTRYVILPTAAYFEFLPFDIERVCVREEQTVDLSGLEVEKMYELVVTTHTGLYRLRMGDIVKVVGFHHTSPEVQFVMRAPKSSAEIITEKDLISAMNSLGELAAEVVEFTSFVDLESEPKQLKIFVEVKDESTFLQNDKFTESVDVLRKSCYVLEGCLGGMYQVMKARGQLRPLLVSIIRPGSFHWLLEEAVRKGAAASQYKPPKIIRNHQVVDYLGKSTVLTLEINSSHV